MGTVFVLASKRLFITNSTLTTIVIRLFTVYLLTRLNAKSECSHFPEIIQACAFVRLSVVLLSCEYC